MKAKISGLPKEHFPVYNSFVEACEKHELKFTNFNVSVGEAADGSEGLIFEMELVSGLTDEKANEIFGSFIKLHPNNYLNYNRAQESILEQQLKKSSETVIQLEDPGFTLEKAS